jgi:hypothetical protein
MELFRRAIVERDHAAWHAVVELYRGVLATQTRKRAVRGLVAEDDGFCIDRAFQRFWAATRVGGNRTKQFGDLASVLKYLQMCLASVLLDEARARRRAAWVSLDDLGTETPVGGDPSEQVVSRLAQRELWNIVDDALKEPNERLIARLSFVGGLSPREILARHPERFTDVFHVYRSKRNMIERLRRSPSIREILCPDHVEKGGERPHRRTPETQKESAPVG